MYCCRRGGVTREMNGVCALESICRPQFISWTTDGRQATSREKSSNPAPSMHDATALCTCVHDGLEHLDLRSAVGSLTIQYGCLSLLSRVLKACGECGDRRVEGRSAEKKVRAAKQILPLERTSEGPEFARNCE